MVSWIARLRISQPRRIPPVHFPSIARMPPDARIPVPNRVFRPIRQRPPPSTSRTLAVVRSHSRRPGLIHTQIRRGKDDVHPRCAQLQDRSRQGIAGREAAPQSRCSDDHHPGWRRGMQLCSAPCHGRVHLSPSSSFSRRLGSLGLRFLVEARLAPFSVALRSSIVLIDPCSASDLVAG